jgi:protein-S-isoprenylcysteine O-methyltransferase Ste14
VLAAHFDKGWAEDVVRGGTGAYLQLMAFAAFIIAVAIIQHHMGIPLSASRTETPPKLCTSGPFRYSRNPIYLAFIVPLAALAYFSPLAAAVSITAYVGAMTRLVICAEERALRLRFGNSFEAYANCTPRWIGIRPPRRF